MPALECHKADHREFDFNHLILRVKKMKRIEEIKHGVSWCFSFFSNPYLHYRAPSPQEYHHSQNLIDNKYSLPKISFNASRGAF